MKQQTTPMELLTLFHKSNDSDISLTAHHQKVLSVLITFINHDMSEGYKAWPNTKTLEKRTGMHEKTIERARKALLAGNWLSQIIPAKGPGSSCVYFINAEKIVSVAALAGIKASDKTAAKNKAVEVKEPHKRNTVGLNQGSMKGFVKPKPHNYEVDPWGDPIDLEEPF